MPGGVRDQGEHPAKTRGSAEFLWNASALGDVLQVYSRGGGEGTRTQFTIIGKAKSRWVMFFVHGANSAYL